MADRPQTSTVREAMRLANAAEEILTRHPYNSEEVAGYLGEIIDAARALNGYQVEDVQEHIARRAERIAAQSPYTVLDGIEVTTDTRIEIEEDGPEEPDDARDARHEPGAPGSPEAEAADRDRIERARARVDGAIGGTDG